MQPQVMTLWAQRGGGAGDSGSSMLFLLIELALIVLAFAGLWGIFVKAGKPGWAAIIPIYNAVVLLEVVGRPIWWIILLFIPCVNIVIAIILAFDVAKSFGKGAGYAIGIIFLPFIFYLLLGFGADRYVGPSAGTPAA